MSEYHSDMTDDEFVQWADENGITIIDINYSRSIANLAYDDGYDMASWEASGKP